MNAIHATKAAHAHGPRTNGAQGAGAANKVAAKGAGGLADLFLGLLTEAMASDATKATGEAAGDKAGSATAADTASGTDAADPSVLRSSSK